MFSIATEQSSTFAWYNHKRAVIELIARIPEADVLEVGGGRAPLLNAGEVPQNVASYAISDISRRELDLAPPDYAKLCFDVCGDVNHIEQRYDIAFSKMLAEHVPSGRRFHENMLKLLKPGGVAFHFMPILYSPPFVINKLLPETASRKLLQTFYPHRTDDGRPKFPAYYSMCYGRSDKLIRWYPCP